MTLDVKDTSVVDTNLSEGWKSTSLAFSIHKRLHKLREELKLSSLSEAAKVALDFFDAHKPVQAPKT